MFEFLSFLQINFNKTPLKNYNSVETSKIDCDRSNVAVRKKLKKITTKGLGAFKRGLGTFNISFVLLQSIPPLSSIALRAQKPGNGGFK
jgi:hypothetical protein